ncbi:hypothetical protein EST38_g9924 [Candolleomyces aberdarensis]|uniref:Uncharacterized protein n=1 Tax=Candolleomyces aberdarensis TaxID=2316362 RepID=A0A4Q2DAW5_9AGAR|nr:hypothetical protein EST38_g9924 [Candolleomyces aberdarensis]
MSAIEVYSPLDSDLHLTLPHDHANSIYTTSPFSSKLDKEFNFVEILPTGDRNYSQVGLDPAFVTALFWAITQIKQVINHATKGTVPLVAVNTIIPNKLFKNLGMKKPKLLVLLEQADINPLWCFRDQSTLWQIISGLQQLGQEAIRWILEVCWHSQILGNQLLWDWEDPCALQGLLSIVGSHYKIAHVLINSASSNSPDSSAPSSPTDSIITLTLDSPGGVFIPFFEEHDNTVSPSNTAVFDVFVWGAHFEQTKCKG